MDVAKVETIIRVVNGDDSHHGLATLAQAVIHVAACVGYSKEEMLRAMAGQWDMYQKIENARLH